MKLYPAIDLKEGNCVRLLHGRMETATTFSKTPENQAKIFENQGARYLHMVDLDGAFAGKPMNAEAVRKIRQTINIPIQLGGGIRDMATIRSWLELGLNRVILGTVATQDPILVKEAAKTFPNRIAVGIDARDGLVATEGWATTTNLKATELAKMFEDAGVCAIIYTDINRDGAMQGPNIEATATLASTVSIPIIASGGVSSYQDLIALRDCGVALEGAISGRAIYDGAIEISKAQEILDA